MILRDADFEGGNHQPDGVDIPMFSWFLMGSNARMLPGWFGVISNFEMDPNESHFIPQYRIVWNMLKMLKRIKTRVFAGSATAGIPSAVGRPADVFRASAPAFEAVLRFIYSAGQAGQAPLNGELRPQTECKWVCVCVCARSMYVYVYIYV